MPKPGDILLYRKFTFDNGSQADKLFIVLNYFDAAKPCLTLKTTSRPEHYQGCGKGCNRERRCFYAPMDWQTCFRIDTYIQLPQIFQFDAAELLRGGIAGKIEFLQSSLTSDCLGQLKSCLSGFKEDISQAHWALIYKAKT